MLGISLSSNLANVVRFWVICKDLFFQVVPVMNFYLKSLSNFSYCCVLQSVERRKGKKRGLFFNKVHYYVERESAFVCYFHYFYYREVEIYIKYKI
jgi:hypothetical protein